ncbi:hypothetical protein EYF80_044364 [Liparis tanakae]|uniref:Uncharacterized protein n=1 Tax=Liparis tanakae TaxID=230148 RepID=A0A4Z2FVY0_9TELE|nr:hypothetical protein EYF80_044364 [Liparis tanakae]
MALNPQSQSKARRGPPSCIMSGLRFSEGLTPSYRYVRVRAPENPPPPPPTPPAVSPGIGEPPAGTKG